MLCFIACFCFFFFFLMLNCRFKGKLTHRLLTAKIELIGWAEVKCSYKLRLTQQVFLYIGSKRQKKKKLLYTTCTHVRTQVCIHKCMCTNTTNTYVHSKWVCVCLRHFKHLKRDFHFM